jgi:glycosyltransferase involved in cell wall biosynthesis
LFPARVVGGLGAVIEFRLPMSFVDSSRRPTRPLRILHVETGRFVYGGAQQVLYLLQFLKAEGIESTLLTCSDSLMVRRAEALGVTVETAPMRGEVDPRLLLKAFRLARSGRFDAIHLHSRRGADSMALLGAKLAGLPIILSRRVDNWEAPFLGQARFGMCDHLVCVADGVGEILRRMGISGRKISVVHSAIEPARFNQPAPRAELEAEFEVPAGRTLLGIAAQLIKRKGHLLVFEAIQRLKDEFPALHLLVFGRGPEEAELKAAVETMGLGDRVTFTGFRDDFNRWVGALDLLVHPAYTEGLANVLLQAASARVPVIATAVGGIPEATGYGTTGLLVPVGDVDALTHGLGRLLRESALRAQFAAAGPAFVDRGFTPPHLAAGNARVYWEKVEERRRRDE